MGSSRNRARLEMRIAPEALLIRIELPIDTLTMSNERANSGLKIVEAA
jgi:hypothetical protein